MRASFELTSAPPVKTAAYLWGSFRMLCLVSRRRSVSGFGEEMCGDWLWNNEEKESLRVCCSTYISNENVNLVLKSWYYRF
jgi:hypothetical protein